MKNYQIKVDCLNNPTEKNHSENAHGLWFNYSGPAKSGVKKGTAKTNSTSLWNKIGDNKVTDLAAKGNKEEVTLQKCMKFPLLIGQVIGLFPLDGILKDNIEYLRFNMKSVKFSFTIYHTLFYSTGAVLSLYRLTKYKMNLWLIAFVILYVRTLVILFQFIWIAKKWPSLMKYVANTELMDPLTDVRLKSRFTTIAIIIMVVATVDYGIFMSAVLSEITACSKVEKGSFEQYMDQTYAWFYEVVPTRSTVIRIFLQAMTIPATFNSIFVDIFIICTSLYLATRLEQLNKRISVARGKYVPSQFWRKMRNDYTRLTKLVVEFDDHFNGLVFISFSSNIFFICLQIYMIFALAIRNGPMLTSCKDMIGIFGSYGFTVYYAESIITLLVRSIVLSMIAARIHTATQEPAITMYYVPSPVYCSEVQRFLDQVHGNTVTLSGLRFFKITRGIVLSVAATIVTYELVLLQFI